MAVVNIPFDATPGDLDAFCDQLRYTGTVLVSGLPVAETKRNFFIRMMREFFEDSVRARRVFLAAKAAADTERVKPVVF